MSSDLAKLRIQRPAAASSRTRLIIIFLGPILLGHAGLYLWGPLQVAPEVTTTVVARLYPAPAYPVLNASSYLVAQRKAAVSSKSTGRLVYLGVEEGSRVKKGQILASLENEDLMVSRGQAIARALITDPTLIAADEPTGDLDKKSAGEIMDLLTQLNREFQKTIIIVTHDPEPAAHASRIRRLIKGQLLNELEPQED